MGVENRGARRGSQVDSFGQDVPGRMPNIEESTVHRIGLEKVAKRISMVGFGFWIQDFSFRALVVLEFKVSGFGVWGS